MNSNWEDHSELRILKRSLINRYILLGPLGEGGFGKVFLLKDKKLGRKCALKVLNKPELDRLEKKDKGCAEEIKSRFIYEAKSYAKCDHPNIVHIYDIGSEENVPYFIMKYVEGKNLKELINGKGKLELNEIIKITEGILCALGYIHDRGIIHRDLKPENIMIEKETGKVVLIDFGLVKDLMNPGLSKSGIQVGTPQYMAPEQWENKKLLDFKKLDIYSCGIMFYEMACGECPYNGNEYEIASGHLKSPIPKITKKNPNLPRDVDNIAEKSMAKNPKLRYESTKVFINDLKKIKIVDKVDSRSIRRDKEKDRKYSGLIIGYLLICAVINLFFFINVLNKKNERTTWELTEIIDTIDAYKDFLKIYPSKGYQEAGRERIVWLRKDRAAFKFAEMKDNIKAYRKYLENFSNGKHTFIAKWRIKDDQLFNDSKSKDTVNAYENYISKFPKGRHIKEALTKLQQFKKKDYVTFPLPGDDEQKVSEVLLGWLIIFIIIGGIISALKGKPSRATHKK